jgi:hypothetical protein
MTPPTQKTLLGMFVSVVNVVFMYVSHLFISFALLSYKLDEDE